MQNNKGFTLVELIVVITILAILGTIAFISLQGYSSESRDSKRISDLGQIRTGLQIEQAREGIVPMPTEAISVGSGGTTYTHQGYAGTGVLNQLRVSEAKDPSDDEYYTYTTNSNQTRYQLVSMLENGETAYNNIIPQTYADYENREAYTIGDPVGTLLEGTTKTPVHQLESATDIDLENNTTEYIPVFTREDNSTTSSGSNLVVKIEETINNIGSNNESEVINPYSICTSLGDIEVASTTYSGCDTKDIIVCAGSGTGYTVSSCNIGTSTASTDWTVSSGNYFQWGRNKGFPSGDTSQQSTKIPNSSYNADNDTYGFVWNSNFSSLDDWLESQDDNLWGHNGGLGTDEQRQGPCISGYHVPSKNEWADIIVAGGWGSDGASMQVDLKLPYSGIRESNTGNFSGGNYGGYWSSTPNGSNGDQMYFSSNNIYASSFNGRSRGFSVRCFKNN